MHAAHLLRALTAAMSLALLGWATPTMARGRVARRAAPPKADPGAGAGGPRQAPAPCVRVTSPAPTTQATRARFNDFARAFLDEKNITRAFGFIAADYVNHDTQAQQGQNGAAAAWAALSPQWEKMAADLRKEGTAFQMPDGWLHYQLKGKDVVDRYRWNGNCIVEHWDQGEKMPPTKHD
ncbi:hypothetical protein P8C59_007498 [Phyllachora maydis]|uniref:Uncharacterized protein n=1 Tax=Phyllachora maydis TaxID=1825666 RepID=A0AAD9MFM2_9PEZI|nr:hypothetical protein P8C59_007498 [Phyllachora maydis]